MKDAPDSWGAVFDGSDEYKGKVTAYDSPIYIADAALYLMKSKPELGIKDPYSLTTEQLDAAAELLKKQRENVSEYWSDYTKEVQAFESGTSVIGTTWQVIANLIGTDNKVQVNTVLPKEGATGWSDTWMISSKAAHPNCMYKWMDWITSPEINAQVAEYFGEAPAQTKACEHHHREGFLRHLPRDRRRLRRTDPLLDDATEAVCRRQRRQLHDLRRVGHQVAADQGVIEAAPISVSTRRRIALAFLLIPPMAWLVLAYLGSLAVLLVSAFWSTNSFTGAVVHKFTTDNIVQAFTDTVFRVTTMRTIGVALLVTAICIVLAVPLALFMAKVASPRMRLLLVIAVTTPLWASYLVKAYAWRMLLSPGGPLAWAGGYTPGYGLTATVITLTYLWLPYMIIPVFAAFDRVPDSLIDASSDLGASDVSTLRMVMAPLVFPGIAAGSIFTFSLSLGDYIAVTIVGGKTQLLGNVIYGQLVTANNQPLAAALSILPLAAIILYLLAMRRTGALENV